MRITIPEFIDDIIPSRWSNPTGLEIHNWDYHMSRKNFEFFGFYNSSRLFAGGVRASKDAGAGLFNIFSSTRG